MTLRTCPREKEVNELVALGQWPVASATAPELRAHVATCRSCRELVLVATAFQHERTQVAGAVRLGPPGVLWWRAQLRQRNAAVERIGRPMLGAHIFALVVNLLLAIGLAVWQARHGVAWLTRLEHLPRTSTIYLSSQWLDSLRSSTSFGSDWNWVVLIPAAATLLLLGGAVIYLVSEKQ